MRKSVIAAAAIVLAIPAQAADKGKPATLDQIMAMPNKQASTCHIEASATGVFLRDDREAQFGAGAGCDAILANLLIGAGFRADFADWRNTGSIFAKIGLVINSGANIYGWAEYKVKDLKLKDSGQAIIGLGTELKLEFVHQNFWIFTEAGAAASKFGGAFPRDELTARTGFRIKF